MNLLVEKIDYSKYEQLFLLGDLMQSSTKSVDELSFLDSIFDLKSPSTHWSYGNHDYGNIELAVEATGRPIYYCFYHNQATYIVLDTQIDQCKIINEQLEMVQACLDTISKSQAIFVLTHKLIWLMDTENLQEKVPKINNWAIGDCKSCLIPNNFYPDVFSQLLHHSMNDKKVFCIAGDIGSNADQFQYEINENLHYLATGLKPDAAEGLGLVFTQQDGEYTWEYVSLGEL